MRHRVNIHKIARECSVRLLDAHEHSPASRRPFECFCKRTVREIGEEYGEGHLRLVFMLMTGTKANARELYADMIKAVSRLIVTNPGLEKRRTLVDEFNSIDLGRLRRNVKAANFGIPNSHVLQVLITTKFSKPVQSDLLDMIEDAA